MANNFSRILTAEAAEVSSALEIKYGFDQSLAEKIATHITQKNYEEAYTSVLDAAGRLSAYVKNCDSAESLQRIYYLLHSQKPTYNYGGFKQIGMENVPDFLLGKISCYMSVFVRGYLPQQVPVCEQTVGIPSEKPSLVAAEKTTEQFSIPNDTKPVATDDKHFSTPNDTKPAAEDAMSRIDELFSNLTAAEAVYLVKKLMNYFITR